MSVSNTDETASTWTYAVRSSVRTGYARQSDTSLHAKLSGTLTSRPMPFYLQCRQTVMRERAAFWATMRSLVAAAAHVYPSLRPHLEALEEVVEEAGQGLPTSSTGGERHAAASAELRESGTWRTGAVASPH